METFNTKREVLDHVAHSIAGIRHDLVHAEVADDSAVRQDIDRALEVLETATFAVRGIYHSVNE